MPLCQDKLGFPFVWSDRFPEPLAEVLKKLTRISGQSTQWLASCPVPTHGQGRGDQNPSLSVSTDDNGKVGLKCHAGCERKAILKAAGLAELHVQTRGGQPSTVDRLVEIGKKAELWTTPQSVAYATIVVGNHQEHCRLDSPAFNSWLIGCYYSQFGHAPNSQAVKDSIATLTAKARVEGKQYPVWLRVARDGEALYLDLANEHWQAVKITSEGWTVLDNPPVKFRRPTGMQALPVPVPGGRLDELRRFVNVTDREWPLLAGVLLGMLKPEGPFPVVNINSEQGSGKTTLSKVIRALIAPNSAPLRAEPKTTQDLAIAAENSWCLAFDNLSHLRPDFADALCRLATRGGFATRQLYTGREEEIFTATRPVILNGIEDIVTRSDLLDRCVLLTLPSISPDKRLPEKEFWTQFEEARPRILGALLDAVVVVLRNLPTTQLPELPRLADFALWVTAAEPALGLKPGEFMEAYEANRRQADRVALESSAVGELIVAFMDKPTVWTGSASQLLSLLHEMPVDENIKKALPKKPNKLSGELTRISPNLRKFGIDVLIGKGKERFIALVRQEPNVKGEDSKAEPRNQPDEPSPENGSIPVIIDNHKGNEKGDDSDDTPSLSAPHN